MNYEADIGRRFPAHPPIVERFNEPVIVYVTLCNQDRKPILAFADSAAVIVDAWRDAKSGLLGHYVIMPDYVHLFCAPNVSPIKSLKQWVRYWKSEASRHWPRRNEHPLWQRDCWDTQLRRHESYDSKWEYVVNNPVRAGLVTDASDWPFQGEVNILPW